MEGNSTTPKNCVLTEFFKSKKRKEILLLPKILFWQNFWNQKNGRKFYYSQKLCFDRIFAWKEYNFPSGFLTNTILNFAQECLFLYESIYAMAIDKFLYLTSTAIRKTYSCLSLYMCKICFFPLNHHAHSSPRGTW